MQDQGRPPDWLDEPARAVLQDLQGAQSIVDLTVVATRIADLNGLSLGILESSGYEPHCRSWSMISIPIKTLSTVVGTGFRAHLLVRGSWSW